MTFPTPKGYISIPDAVDRVLRTLHGEPKTVPWSEKDLDQEQKAEGFTLALDKAVLDRGRERDTEAQDWLITRLSAGRLVAEVGDVEVPAEYWTCYGAHTTAHTGIFQPPEMSAWVYPELAKLANQPCFIERSAFEEQLSPKNKGGRPKHQHDEIVEAVLKELSAQVEQGAKKPTKSRAFWAVLNPLELDGAEHEALMKWLYDEPRIRAFSRETSFPKQESS